MNNTISEKSTFRQFDIPYATGSTLSINSLDKDRSVLLSVEDGSLTDNPVSNTDRINAEIMYLHESGGGNLIIGEGSHPVYTIELKSNVNLFLKEGAVLVAAPVGEGNYLEPEVRFYAGIQDHGHTYFRNSLIYAENEENIMIAGPGGICGKRINEEGYIEYVLSGADQRFPDRRDERGYKGEWHPNKAIALLNCRNVILHDFTIDIGGHFAILATGVDNLLISKLVVDTNRDALDVDCCSNVTIRDGHFNSLTDDAIVMKASYGAERFKPIYNVLVENCRVSGYDAGSVVNGTYSTNKKVAEDMCGPTGRVKLGTESTCGYDLVTIRNIDFDRSRGICLETVDGSPLTNVIVEDIRMKNISSSPIFLRVGDRGRFPVTGENHGQEINKENVRLDNPQWVLPHDDRFEDYPPKRFKPSYVKNFRVDDGNGNAFYIVNPVDPTRINPMNPDVRKANACGYDELASIKNVIIRNVKATDVDRRYPILLAGLVDSRIENVEISNVSIEYRGGLSMEDAVLQKQEYETITFSQEGTKPLQQKIPLMVNPFFSKSESLLKRQSVNKQTGELEDDPFNVPEMVESYPESSQFGILPAYGAYVRHAENVIFKDINISTYEKDGRSVICLDDVKDASLIAVTAATGDLPDKIGIAAVTNNYKRHTNMEYVKGEPYFTTCVEGLYVEGKKPSDLSSTDIQQIVVDAPSPGTPKDELYS